MNLKQRKIKAQKRAFHNRKLPALVQGQLVEIVYTSGYSNMPKGAKIGDRAIVVFDYPKTRGRGNILVVHPEWDGHPAWSMDHCFYRITDGHIMKLIENCNAWFVDYHQVKALKKLYK